MDALRDKYIRACKYKPSLEQNFVRSHKNTIVGFIGTSRLESQISVLDDDFNILLSYDVKAYIGSCTISDDGKHIAWQTAYARTEDGASLFLYDVYHQQLLFKVPESEPIKYHKGLFIDSNDGDVKVICHYKTADIIYDINGKIISKS